MQIASRLDPLWRHDAKGLHAKRRAFAFASPQLGLVGLEGGEIVPVAFGSFGPCQPRAQFCTFTQPGLAGLVAAFCVEGGTAQLGDAGDLVDADGGLEHQRYDLRLVTCEAG